MALSNYTVRCIKMLSPEALEDRVNEIIADSYSDEEEARVLALSTTASAWGF